MNTYDILEHGQGLPLVMLHGMMGWPENWQGLFPHLPESCHPIALEIPFFKEGLLLDSVPAVTAYVQGYLDQAGHKQVVLCGNSLGGHVSLLLTLANPEKVAGLVLTGSSGLFERGFSSTQGSRPSREWVQEKIREIFYEPQHASDELIDKVCALINVRRNARDLVRIAKSAKRDNVGDRLGRIQCPVLQIWGRNDAVTPPEVAEEFHQKIPNSELAWIDKCGHAPMMEHPEEFARLISRWWMEKIVPETPAADTRRILA